MVLMTTTYNFFVRMMIAAANSRKLQKNLAASAFGTNCAADPPSAYYVCLACLACLAAALSCSVTQCVDTACYRASSQSYCQF